jgi:hydroxymethylpyrimidine pyrophosphatase-like HAD family hydrolase
VAEFGDRLDRATKIVGVSDDLDRVRRCGTKARAVLGTHATASQSQLYYLDITNKDANKGAVVDYLSAHLHIPFRKMVTIGDQPTDMLIFK